MQQYHLWGWDVQSILQYQVGVQIPWMHHSDSFSVDCWIKYGPGSLALTSKLSTFSKGFWSYPFYMGNRDKETSEYLGSKYMELSENPNRVLKRPLQFTVTGWFLDTKLKQLQKLKRKTKYTNPCAFFLSFLPCVTSWTFMTPGSIQHSGEYVTFQ